MKAIILGSGSKGNSTLLVSNNKKILIDVGFSYPKMKMLLNNYNTSFDEIDAILITHTHKDHILGLGSVIKKHHIKVYTNIVMYQELIKLIDEENIIVNEDEFQIDNFNISVIHTSHDAIGSVGFIINDDINSLVYITDTGYINQVYMNRLMNKNLYIMESNHDIELLMTGPYPYILKQRVISDKGHLSNEMTGNYLKEIIGNDTKKIVLAHLSETNNEEDIAIKTIKSIVPIIDRNIDLLVAKQDESIDIGDF